MKLRALLLALVLAAIMPGSNALAHTPTHAAVDVFAYEAYAFRSIVATDDLFIVMRYELPISTAVSTNDAWCAELNDADACDGDPAAPTDPTSLVRGSAFATLYSDGYGGTLVEQVTLTRIDHALTGIYVDAGHSITFGNAVTQVCIESSTTLFTSPTVECLSLVWSAATNTEQGQRDDLAAVMAGPTGPMVNLQSARLQSANTYISGVNLITPAGQVFALEAMSFMDRIIPNAFQLSAGPSITTAIATPSSDSDIQQMLDATAVASGITQDLENVGQQYLGLSGATTALTATLVVAFGLGGLMWSLTKSPALAILGTLTPLTWAMWVRAPTFAVIAAMIAVFATLGTWYFIRKAPQ